jgi:hypothetical protein
LNADMGASLLLLLEADLAMCATVFSRFRTTRLLLCGIRQCDCGCDAATNWGSTARLCMHLRLFGRQPSAAEAICTLLILMTNWSEPIGLLAQDDRTLEEPFIENYRPKESLIQACNEVWYRNRHDTRINGTVGQ